MARITVEDCLDNVDNRFELVMVSSKRARQIQAEEKIRWLKRQRQTNSNCAPRDCRRTSQRRNSY